MKWYHYDFRCESGYRGAGMVYAPIGTADQELRRLAFADAAMCGFRNVHVVDVSWS